MRPPDADSEDTKLIYDLKPNVFPDGSITKVIYHNFLTYEHVVMIPGTGLNLIIGTNGSGKSSLICGICLAVGGTPKDLGRSERFGDYIRHGCDSASVELHISDSTRGTQKIKMELAAQPVLQYSLNGKIVKQSDIRTLVAEYNIQVDNPCTFLAQDKVKSFAEQSKIQLLENTERAGDADLLVVHKELIERKKASVKDVTAVEATQKRLTYIAGELAGLIPRVAIYRQKQALQTKITLLEQKKCFLDHEVFRKEANLLKNYLNDAKKRNATKNAELDEISDNKEEYHRKMSDIKQRIRENNDKFRACNTPKFSAAHYTSQIEKAETQYKETKVEVDTFDKKRVAKEKEIELYSQKMAAVTREADEAREQIEDIIRRKRLLNQDFQAVNDMKDECQELKERRQELEQRMKDANYRAQVNRSDERVQLLSNMRAGPSAQLWLWYQQNKTHFEHPVYMPLLHMIVKPEWARVVENLVPNRDLPMFICGSKHDEDLLTSRATNDGHTSVSVTVVPPETVKQHEINARIPNQLHQLGFVHWGIELFTAPDVVKQYLCNTSMLHKIPIGTRKTQDMYEEVMETLVRYNILRFYTDTEGYFLVVSKYSRETIRSSRSLRDPWFFNKPCMSKPYDTVDPNIERYKTELVRLENDLMVKSNELTRRINEFNAKNNPLKEEHAACNKKITTKATFETSLINLKAGLENHLNQKPNLLHAETALKEAQTAAARNSMRYLKGRIVKMEESVKINLEIRLDNLLKNNLDRSGGDFEGQIQLKKVEIKQSKDMLEHSQKNYDAAAVKLDVKNTELREICKLRNSQESKMNDADKQVWAVLKQKFEDEEIPEDIANVERLLQEETIKKNIAGRDGSREDEEKLESLTKEQSETEKNLAQMTADRKNWTDNMTKAVNDWRAPVEKLVKKINDNYTSFFAEIGCTGEVQLDVPPDMLDIGEYGITILVSFRPTEKLKPLDSKFQSGGERSVATMLYLLSLQELCPVPFRCVDEINQGMDPTNERKVFDIMVNKLSGNGNLSKTQYFLLTPKLLHGLTYNDKVTVQLVHNGPALDKDAHKWDPNNFLAIMRSKKAAADRN